MRDVDIGQPPGNTRLRALYRGLKRQLPIKLTSIQQVALNRAAAMTLRAERALSDPRVSHEDAVRLDHAAAQARREWQRVVDARKAQAEAVPSLDDYLGSAGLAR
jgi:hypothetical protein